jgi:dTDP-4-amino-4,6-dideoxygalactose transaminase
MLNNSFQAAKNFLPDQYLDSSQFKINHNYLSSQFSDYKEIFEELIEVVLTNDFTLGSKVDQFENKFANLHNSRFGIGVGSGTDAIFLSLKALGIGPGDEIITSPFTFFATVGAIATTGAKPIFVDVELDGFNIDISLIESAITSKTRAIVPVHWAGRICNMKEIRALADHHNLVVVEDACHAVAATRDGYFAGQFSDAACFSLHPLKNLNVWGDGGIILTNSEETASRLRLLRNHGLINRDECIEFAYNSRLDTIQAVIGGHLFKKLPNITQSRITNSMYLDSQLNSVKQIQLNTRNENIKEVFHLYSFLCKDRDGLQNFLKSEGIDAKIHYPIPLHLQRAANYLNYKVGDFPVSEYISKHIISLPVHEFITKPQLDFMAQMIRKYYGT